MDQPSKEDALGGRRCVRLRLGQRGGVICMGIPLQNLAVRSVRMRTLVLHDDSVNIGYG